MKIKGTVRYINLEMGFWGIESADGQKYVPIQMPEQLKMEGKKVEIRAEIVPDAAGVQMWGKYVQITEFET